MRLTLIWAQARNRAIGKNNQLPWHIPADFQHFKAITAGKPILMGRKTWESLPRKPLPGRLNLVVSSTASDLPGASVFSTLDAALEYCRAEEVPEVVCIGGAQVYAALLPAADEVWVTEVDLDVPQADAFAPALDLAVWDKELCRNLSSSPVATVWKYTRRM